MVFFRLGKLDRGGTKDEKEKAEVSPDRRGAEAESTSSAASGSLAPQDREKEKSDKSKKKPKDGEGSGGSASGEARAASGVPARVQAGLSVNDFISKTKNQQRQGLKPSGPELIAYARYLGIDPVADHDLLWIAVEALEAPLPSDWTEHFDSNDRVFYYNATMRVSSWTHPLEHIYRETYKTIVNFRNANMAPQERGEKLHTLQHEVKQMEHEVHKEIAQWTEHTDEQGNRFYFNREERQSTWTDPRPAKCQILYLRMKMLRLLQSSAGATQGFSDSKAAEIGRFAPILSSGDFDESAFKRPKVGAVRSTEGSARDSATRSPRPLPLGADAGWIGSQTGDSDAEAGAQDLGRSVPSSPSSPRSESEEDKKKKKKKKKKKNKKRQEAPATPPPRPGAAQNLRSSQSEPSVGGKSDEGRSAASGLGGMQTSPSGPQTLGLDPFNHTEGLSTVGRARVKASIRLEPITAAPPVSNGGAVLQSTDKAPLDWAPKGIHNSASVPLLQP